MSELSVAAAQSGNFFTENDEHLRALFGELGLVYPDTSNDLVTMTQPWLQGDHVTTDSEPYTTLGQRRAARDLFTRLEMYDEHVLSNDITADEANLVAGLAETNVRLPMWLKESGIQLADHARLTAWTGPRMPCEKEYPAIERLLAETEFADDDPWIIRQHADEQDPSKVDELAQSVLGLRRAYGKLALKRVVLREDHTRPGVEIPQELVSHYVLEAEQTPHEIVLLNALPVMRKGPPRHTTASCADEWLSGPFALTHDSEVAIITGAPYTRRITQNVQDRIDRHHRTHPDAPRITAHGVGPSPMPHIHDGIRRGELARWIYDAHQRQPVSLR